MNSPPERAKNQSEFLYLQEKRYWGWLLVNVVAPCIKTKKIQIM